MQAPAIRAIGATAHRALLRSAGRVDVLARLRDACYARAGDEIVCITRSGAAMHPRTVVVASLECIAARVPGAEHARPWRAPRPPSADEPWVVRARARALRPRIAEDAPMQGFAAMLDGDAPPFPLDRAIDHVERLARACRTDDADAACDAALPLLGLGPGFTPSGDDLVGALFFARRALARSPVDAQRWLQAGDRLRAASETRTHSIAAALFGDLVDGESFAPLHALVAALATGDEPAGDAARALVAIGHSSGWDMLAGVLIAVTGRIGEQPAVARERRSAAESVRPLEPTCR